MKITISINSFTRSYTLNGDLKTGLRLASTSALKEYNKTQKTTIQQEPENQTDHIPETKKKGPA